MKKLILLAGVASLAACTEPAVEEEAPAEDVAMEAEAEESMAGTYDVNWPDGTTSQTVMNEDGTWSSMDEEGNPITGTYAENEAGQTCFDQDGDDEGPRCWTDGETDADGWTTSTDDEGVTITYRMAEDA